MLALHLGDPVEIVGNTQHAMATARRGMIPSVALVVSPSLSTHGARQGGSALDIGTGLTERLPAFSFKHMHKIEFVA